MAKKSAAKSAPKGLVKSAAKPAAKSTVVAKTAVRNTSIPKAAPARREVTVELISQRAYEIWQSQGGSQDDNWFRAERELRGA